MPFRHVFRRPAAMTLAGLIVLSAAPLSANDAQTRVEALVDQMRLRYGDQANAFDTRAAAVRATIDAWNAADATGDRGRDPEAVASNAARLDAWLSQAIAAVLPGGRGRLPAPPTFESIAAESVAEAVKAPIVAARSAAGDTGGSRTRAASADGTRRVAKPRVGSPRTPETPARSKWSQHPAAAPLEWTDPFADDPAASPNPLRSGDRRSALRPTFQSPRVPASRAARIDLTQLVAEVRAYNAALRRLQLDVLSAGEQDHATIREAASTLERLEAKRGFLDLYRQGLAGAGRDTLPASPSADLVRELVRRRAERLPRGPLSDSPNGRAGTQLLTGRKASVS